MGCCEEGTVEVGVTIDEENALALGQFGVPVCSSCLLLRRVDSPEVGVICH